MLISCVVNCIITFDSGDLTTNISARRVSSDGKVSLYSVIKCKIKDHRFEKIFVFPNIDLFFQIKLVLLIESFALFSVVSIIKYVHFAVFQ